MNDMNDSSNSGDKTLTMTPSKTLSLKRPVEQGMVRQASPMAAPRRWWSRR